MGQQPDRWTSDHLLTLKPYGMHIYAEQIREHARRQSHDFRLLALEVFTDLKATPPEGDNKVQGWVHAWQVAHVLHQMERHARAIMGLAKTLEKTHKKIYIDLPEKRAEKDAEKALNKANRQQIAAGTAAQLNQTLAQALPEAPPMPAEPPKAPVFDLFKSTGS
ncbi:hypothetical protein [Streptomyces sp. XH2]|uniref:hypothetical protein n=1 Tax=Streptomyces sp. XH2 TaxID=3412483 RepID=UPI003C7C28BA